MTKDADAERRKPGATAKGPLASEDTLSLYRRVVGQGERTTGLFYSRLRPRLMAKLKGIKLPADVDAEEVVNVTLFEVIRSASLEAYGSPTAFALRILQNKVIGFWRAARADIRDEGRRTSMDDVGGAPLQVADCNSLSPAESAELNEIARLVNEALKNLTDAEREILALHEHQGLRFARIASLLGLNSESTARSQFHRAKLHRNKLLRPICGDLFTGESDNETAR